MLPEWITNPNPEIYLSGNVCTLDIETTNLDKGDARHPENRIVYGCLRTPTKTWDIHSCLDLKELESVILAHDFVICHNASFETKWMRRAGIDIHHVLPYCTMLGEYVIGGNRTGEGYYSVTLEESLGRWGLGGKEDEVSKLIKSGVCPSTINPEKLKIYCKQDVDQTYALFMLQRRRLYRDGLLPVFFLRNLFTGPCVDMEFNGMHLDHAVVTAVDKELVEEVASVRGWLETQAGINLNSWQQRAWFMYKGADNPHPKCLNLDPATKYGKPILNAKTKYFKNGSPSTKKECIDQVKDRQLAKRPRRWIDEISRYITATKALSTYTSKFVEECKGDSIFYGGLGQAITKTHRLASSPNLQNIAVKLKMCFNARPEGWLIGNADYDGFEFRIAGQLGADEQIAEDIRLGRDPHSFTASQMFGTPWPYNIKTDGSPEENQLRNRAKADTFKPLYGGQTGSKIQKAYYAAFRERYPGVTRLQEGWLQECIDYGRFSTVTGLILYFPNTKRLDNGYVTNTGKIYNIPVQQFATADCGPLGATLLWHYLHANHMQSFLVNYVHDSCVAEVHPDEVKQFKNFSKLAMCHDMIQAMEQIIDYKFTIPIEVEVKVQDHWGINLKEY